ncbi:hypothetical protein KX729_29430 [Rhizobium sp. XQZ8]|uniref:hypothetical protein n=1 Tax=Rhizobium populisoli TaxID=2859785 RepID=UPI001CA4AE76|nr:hypothetical protein [Rhizobium populisoli]MBW6425538.1 hypothetical protein [Rhizobium populisoli]
MRTLLISSFAFLAATASSFAAEFGDLAGTYTGKTPKGSAIVIVVPKSGTPTYRFAGDSVRVSNATVSGKTINLNVGPNGLGRVSITASAKGASYKYSDDKGGTSATLSRQ